MSGHRVNAFMTCSTASLYILIHIAYYEEFHFSFNMCIIWSLPILSGTYILINIYVPDFIYTHMMYIPAVYTVKKWAKFLSIKLSQYFLTQLWAASYITKCKFINFINIWGRNISVGNYHINQYISCGYIIIPIEHVEGNFSFQVL